jgi:hypothetical protein
MLYQGRRWIQPAEAARLLGISPHTLKRLIYQGRVDGFTIEERPTVNGKTFHWLALDEVMAATNGADLSLRLRKSKDSDD